MTLAVYDRVRETTTTTGTGTITLLGAVVGYQTFNVVGNGNTTYYTIAGQGTTEWEVGIGTFTLSGTTLARTTVLSNSLGTTALISFSAGTKDVFVTYPSEKAVYLDASGNATLTGNLSITGTLGVTGVATLTAKPILSSLTASQAVFSDATKGLVSNAITGTGNVVMSASPTLTGTAAGASLSLSSLTATRVTYAGTAGLLQDSANLTFNGTTLTSTGFAGPLTGAVTGNASTATALQTSRTIFGQSFDGTANVTGSVTSSALTSGRVTYAGTGGLLQDDADLTFDGSTLTTLNSAYTGTLTGGTGVVNLGSGQFYKDASGNVGIGTSSPYSQLDVYSAITASTTGEATGVGSIRITNGVSALSSAGGLEFKIAGDSNGYGSKIQALNSGGSQLVFATRTASATWSEQMRITAAGNVGIGTSSPSSTLTVGGNPPTAGAIAAVGAAAGISLALSDNVNCSLYVRHPAAGPVIGTDGGNALRFATNGNAASDEKMRIDSSGNVGIGTSSLTYTLEVNGTGRFNNSGAGGGTAFFGNNLDGGLGKISAPYNSAIFTIANTTANAIGFNTSGTTERMRIDSSGNVGIGTSSPPTGVRLTSTAPSSTGYNYFIEQDNGLDGFLLSCTSADGHLKFFRRDTSGSNTMERMRLNANGALLVNQTAAGDANSNSFSFGTSGWGNINHINGTGTSTGYLYFGYNGSSIGSITQNGTTGVLYNIVSDQRLKENIVDAPLGNIDDVKVRSFDFKSDGSHVEYGFIAQELVEVAPYAVHQPQDPKEMMAVDYSKLVPMMIKEIQDLRKRVAQLESK